jgi:serine/threonine protein phosphatase PrpC
VSRSIGDHNERPYITSDAYIVSFLIDCDIHKFLILACDGVWDVVSDQRAAELVFDTWNSLPKDLPSHQKLSYCSAVLRDYSYALHSLDNISALILKFNSTN